MLICYKEDKIQYCFECICGDLYTVCQREFSSTACQTCNKNRYADNNVKGVLFFRGCFMKYLHFLLKGIFNVHVKEVKVVFTV